MTAPVTKERFVVPDNSADVWDKWGKHYIQRSLWDDRLLQGRTDWANHHFELGERLDEPDIPFAFHRVPAACTRCGEDRLVYHGVDLADLNRGWCIPQRTPLWRRIAALF